MYRKFIFFLNSVIFLSLLLSFATPTEAALTCTGQWPGSKVDFYVKQGGSGGPIIAQYHYDDLGNSGWSGGTENITVDPGTVLYFEGYAAAPDQFSPSTWEWPYGRSRTFSEGVFPTKRSDTSTRGIDSPTYFRWTIDGWCSETPDPDWHGGLFDMYINIDVNTAPLATICVAVYGAPSAHFSLTKPNGDFNRYDTNSYCTDDITGTWSVGELTSLAGYDGPYLKAPGTSQTVNIGLSQNVGAGGWIGWDIAYIQKKYKCDSGGQCVQDNVNGNTTSSNCNNSCSVPSTNTDPNPPTISGPASGYTNTSYNYSFAGTDPDGDKVRYGIDWSNPADGVADEWIPNSGYINSGTSFTTPHSWSTTGTKSVKALTQDINGANSSWAGPYNVTISTQPVGVDGKCGTAATSYPASATTFSGSMCLSGTVSPLSPTFPVNPGDSTSWFCLGTGTGVDVSCSADRLATGNNLNVSVSPFNSGTVQSNDNPKSINCGPDCTQSYPSPTTVTLQAYPSSSYWRFNGWSGACSGVGQCVLNVTGTKVVNASFVLRLFNYKEF